LKVFTGNFDTDEPTDVTIKGMEDSMKYPLRYGYCSVGKIVQVGKGVSKEWLDKTVFTFSPHGTLSIVDAIYVKEIPEGISPYDAVFAPSVETAVSLVQDTQPILVKIP
jgi:hypothetical protein